MSSGHDDAGLASDLLNLALREDLGDDGDITSKAFIPAESVSRAKIVAREGCIASGLSTASSPFTAAILSAANYLTASICQTTGNMPADVCTSPAVKTAVHKGL